MRARWRAHHPAESEDGGHGASAPLPTQRRKSIEMSRSKSDIIRALFAAYMANDRKAVEACFTDDFTFTSPYDDCIDKATYFVRCWRVPDWIERQQLEKIFVEGDEAFVTYEVVAKDGKRFRNTEFFRFDGDKVRSIDVYFGASYQDGAFVKQPMSSS
jgi:ketosteroid isomerase-like protein